MYLSVPEWPTGFSKSVPLENVLVYLIGLGVDFNSMVGTVSAGVYMNEASASDGSDPVATYSVACGQSFTFKNDEDEDVTVTFPSLAQILTDNAEHFGAIKAYLYDKMKYMPMCKNGTVVTT